MDQNLVTSYHMARNTVIERGYGNEIIWQDSLSFDQLDEGAFLRELAWVILSSGMRESVVRRLFLAISEAFFNWESAGLIAAGGQECYRKAIRSFNNPSKIGAIVSAAQMINEIGFGKLKSEIADSPIETLRKFPYIGPVTVFHLAKNIGIPVAKPDRHLSRIATLQGYDNVQDLCLAVSRLTGDSVPVVDIVFWRFATIEPRYLDLLRDIHCDSNAFSRR
jgi:hypothetical protein